METGPTWHLNKEYYLKTGERFFDSLPAIVTKKLLLMLYKPEFSL